MQAVAREKYNRNIRIGLEQTYKPALVIGGNQATAYKEEINRVEFAEREQLQAGSLI